MLKQFLKFSLVGLSNAAVNFLVYNLTLWLLHLLSCPPEYDYLPAQLIGFAVSVLWAFCMSRKFVFTSREERSVVWYKALLKMYLAYGFTGVMLNSALSLLWIRWLHLPKQILPLLNDTVGFPVNFLLIKFWSFRNKTRR